MLLNWVLLFTINEPTALCELLHDARVKIILSDNLYFKRPDCYKGNRIGKFKG